ncbi:unnamed protein product [Coffea canephora]|uniref:Copper transport protein n=1 Tax=Coffea canephora TaxID=49390 RepID=A0A068V0R0_COFCA|nr:unnamed protein product [Coffea canephora]
MMHMTFYWGKKVTLLFDFWKTDSWTSYAFTLLACLIVSIFYQYMEDRRLRFRLLSTNKTTVAPPPQDGFAANSTTTPLLYSRLLTPNAGKLSVARFAGAVLFGVNSAIGYLLMLAIMSFNGGVFVAVVLGLALGYFLFRASDEGLVVVDNPCACA